MSEYFGCVPTSIVPSRVATERSPLDGLQNYWFLSWWFASIQWKHQLVNPKESLRRTIAAIFLSSIFCCFFFHFLKICIFVCPHLLLGFSEWVWLSRLSTEHSTMIPQSLLLVRISYMDVSKNRGTPKSSILIGFSIINHPFWGIYPYFWKHPYNFSLNEDSLAYLAWRSCTTLPSGRSKTHIPQGHIQDFL